jgi:tetratricopeptide (TPR) repeat protein
MKTPGWRLVALTAVLLSLSISGAASSQAPGRPAAPVVDPRLAAALRERLARPDLEGAAEMYDRLRRADPQERGVQLDPRELLRLAEAFTEEARHDEAILQVLRARKRQAAAGGSYLPRAAYVLGRIYADRGDYLRAAEVLSPCASADLTGEVSAAERRECRFAAMAVAARLGRYARAEALASELLADALPDEHPAIRLLKGLLLHAQGDVRAAVEFFGREYTRPDAPVTAAAYYAIRALRFSPGDLPALERALAPPRAESEPFLSRWARLVVDRRAGRPEDRAQVLDTLDSIYAPRPALGVTLEPVTAATLRWLRRAVEGDFVQAFLADAASLPWLAARLERPDIGLRIVGGVRGARYTHVEIRLSVARGVRAVTLRSSSQAFPLRLQISHLLPSLSEDRGLRFFVPVALNPGENLVEVTVDMLGDAEDDDPGRSRRAAPAPRRRKQIAITGEVVEPRVQVLVAAIERYAWDRPRVVETARADAIRVARALGNIGDGETVSVDVLLNNEASRERIRQWVLRPRQGGDLTIVYLRGLETALAPELNVRLAFVPADGRADSPASLITVPEVLSWLEIAGSGHGLILVDTEPLLAQGEVVQTFFGVIAGLWRPRPSTGTVTLLASKFPLSAPRAASEHGQSAFVLALLENLNGLNVYDADTWNGTLWTADVVAGVRAYFERETVVTALSLLSLHRPFSYQQAAVSFPMAEQSDVLQVFRAARQARHSPDPQVRELARLAVRLCRATSRSDPAERRLELLALLLRAAGDDPGRAFRQWAAAY